MNGKSNIAGAVAAEEAAPQVISSLLASAGAHVLPDVVATWTVKERSGAVAWAASMALHEPGGRVQALPQPHWVTRAAEICASPAVAQLAVEAWTRHKEICEEAQPVESPEWVSARMAQDAITGLLALLGDRTAVSPARRAL